MNTEKQKSRLLSRGGVQSVLSSLLCILIGLLAGYVVLLCINPAGAAGAMSAILRNFLYFPKPAVAREYFGSTLAKSAPLLMCTLSILFSYKAGLFNIGASGQYAVGAGLALYLALAHHMPWYVCAAAAAAGGALMGAAAGALKAYLNVNEVIAGIMLNWISLYNVNLLLGGVREGSSTYTAALRTGNPAAKLPASGLQHLFSENQYVTIAIPLSVLFAVLVWFVLEKTRFGYELKASGFNRNAAKYAGMKEQQIMILAMACSGALAGLGAAFLYLSGIEQWNCGLTNIPAMGFNGIAAAFLGGLHPLGAVFSAYFIQHITSGGSYVNRMLYPSQISDLISAIIIYACGFAAYMKLRIRKYAKRREGRA